MIIGAYTRIRWKDEVDDPLYYEDAYFSFGDYNEEEERDTYGYPDMLIFYYAGGEQEIKDFMDPDGVSEFVVVEYDLNEVSGV